MFLSISKKIILNRKEKKCEMLKTYGVGMELGFKLNVLFKFLALESSYGMDPANLFNVRIPH